MKTTPRIQLCILSAIGVTEQVVEERARVVEQRHQPRRARARSALTDLPLLVEFEPRPPMRRSMHPDYLTKREQEQWVKLEPGWDDGRPRNRDECVDGPRPCPWVSCRYHAYLEVDDRHGTIKFNHRDVHPDQLEKMADTCTLDVADRYEGKGAPLFEVATVTGLSYDRAYNVIEEAKQAYATAAQDLGEEATWIARRRPTK